MVRKIFTGLVLAGLLGSFSACEEIPPVIGECQTDRVVLIEEFTGVRCVNCPIGSQKIEQLLEQFGTDKLIAVAIHAGFFSVPYSFASQDYTTTEGQGLDAFLGPVTSYPAACINRKIFPNETQRPLGVSSWAGYIGTELCKASPVGLTMTSLYDTASRRLTVSAAVRKINNTPIAEKLNISLLLTETGMIDPQLDAAGIDSFYVHKHVLRRYLTDYKGQAIHPGNAILADYDGQFTFTIPQNWNPQHMHVVGFVHQNGDQNKKEIVQAIEKKIIP